MLTSMILSKTAIKKNSSYPEGITQCYDRSLWLYHIFQMVLKTKIRKFNNNVKSVLLYECETWKVSTPITNKL